MRSDTWLGELTAVRSDGDDAPVRTTRRSAILGAGALAVAGITTPALLSAERASAHVATGSLSIDGDSITTDDGQLDSLTVSITEGHVSYDGLDRAAESVEVELFAAPAGGDLEAVANRIASQTFVVGDEESLDTYAGHRDYTFTDADVLAADDLSRQDLSAQGDGTTEQTDVDFRVSMSVVHEDGSVLAEAAETDAATIEVTNEERSSGANGNGGANAGGTNQQPG